MVEKVPSNIIVKIKDCNIMIDGINFSGQPMKNELKTYDKIRKLQLLKVMITQLDVYQIMPISKNTINQLQYI